MYLIKIKKQEAPLVIKHTLCAISLRTQGGFLVVLSGVTN